MQMPGFRQGVDAVVSKIASDSGDLVGGGVARHPVPAFGPLIPPDVGQAVGATVSPQVRRAGAHPAVAKLDPPTEEIHLPVRASGEPAERITILRHEAERSQAAFEVARARLTRINGDGSFGSGELAEHEALRQEIVGSINRTIRLHGGHEVYADGLAAQRALADDPTPLGDFPAAPTRRLGGLRGAIRSGH